MTLDDSKMPLDENECDSDNEFETTAVDAEASFTYPCAVGKIKKGGELMVKGRPCVVKTMTDISNGKHGAAKHHYVATDMFTGAKVEEIITGHKAPVPFVKKQELQVLHVDEGFVSCLDLKTCKTRADLKLPALLEPEPAGAVELSERIRRLADEERDFCVIVLSACGREQIIDTKVMSASAG